MKSVEHSKKRIFKIQNSPLPSLPLSLFAHHHRVPLTPLPTTTRARRTALTLLYIYLDLFERGFAETKEARALSQYLKQRSSLRFGEKKVS
jgi:hypothetical protein